MNKPQKRKSERVVQHVEHQVHYQGPIPPPAIMEQMEKLLPGAADRIFVMAEKDQDAQIAKLERRDSNMAMIARSEHTENMTALWMAFVVCLVFVVCGTFLVINGYEKTGAALIGTTLLGVITSFLSRRRLPPNKHE